MSSALPRRATAVALAAALSAALTGCGAGFQAQTYQERNNADSAEAAASAIGLRNVRVLPPTGEAYEPGADAFADLTLVNDGSTDDRLVSVTSDEVDSVEIVERGSTTALTDLEIPALGTTGEQYGLLLRGLTDEVRPGDYVDLVFRFDRNGQIELKVPIATTGEYDADQRERSENFHPPGSEEEGEGSPGEGLPEAGENSSGEQDGGEG